MTKTFDNKFHKQPFTDKERNYLKRQFSLKKIFLSHAVLSVPILLLLVLCCFFPWFPHTTYGFGTQNPSSVKNYFEIVGGNILVVLCFIIIFILLTTIISFLRAQIDIVSNFKSIGTFTVTKIIEKNQFRFIRLSNGKRLKHKSSEIPFNKLNEQDLVEISKTATNRQLALKVLT